MATALYGAWISPQGNLIPVPEESHYEIAIEILDGLGLLKERFLRRLNSFTSSYDWRHVYRIMLCLGYCRVVFDDNGIDVYGVEVSRAHTKRHRQWIKSAEVVDYECHFNRR